MMMGNTYTNKLFIIDLKYKGDRASRASYVVYALDQSTLAAIQLPEVPPNTFPRHPAYSSPQVPH